MCTVYDVRKNKIRQGGGSGGSRAPSLRQGHRKRSKLVEQQCAMSNMFMLCESFMIPGVVFHELRKGFWVPVAERPC